MRKSIEEEKNQIKEDQDLEHLNEKETILFRNIDANVDKYSKNDH